MTLVQWLLALVGPLARQACVSLGLGIISYVGVSALITSALSSAQGAWGGAAGEIASFMNLCGANQALGIIAAGITARGTLMASKRIGFK